MENQTLFNFFADNHDLILTGSEMDDILSAFREATETRRTLSDSKMELNVGLEKGITCPCCGQFAKRYKRNLSASMCYALILIHKSRNSDFFHVSDYFHEKGLKISSVADWSKLRHWGFIESKAELREDGSDRNGYYKITDRGINFVRRRITAPAHAFIFNNKVKALADERVDIETALKKKFDFQELMFGQPSLFNN